MKMLKSICGILWLLVLFVLLPSLVLCVAIPVHHTEYDVVTGKQFVPPAFMSPRTWVISTERYTANADFHTYQRYNVGDRVVLDVKTDRAGDVYSVRIVGSAK